MCCRLGYFWNIKKSLNIIPTTLAERATVAHSDHDEADANQPHHNVKCVTINIKLIILNISSSLHIMWWISYII